MAKNPTAIRRGSAAIDEVRSELVGKSFQGVEYFVAAGDRWPYGHRNDSAIHEVDMGLSLRVGDSSFHLTWAASGSEEGLAVLSGAAPAGFFGISTEAIDVGNIAPWPSLLGRAIVGFGCAWHWPREDCAELLWAIRVDLESSSSVVVSLGVSENGQLRYLPDSLLVIFDADLAHSYSIPAGSGSSWGNGS